MKNPYESPAAIPARVEPEGRKVRSPSWMRGLAWAVPMFFVGAAIPFAIPAICFVVDALSGNSAELIDSTLAWPSVGCGMLFSLAAVRNFSPPKPAGFFACLMVVGSVGIACLVFASLLAVLSIALRQSYGQIAWRPVWLLLVVLAPVCFTYFSTKKLMFEQPPTNSD